MSFLFLTEAGGNYGIGHMTRCGAVAQALSEQWKESVFIIDAAPETVDTFPHSVLALKKWQNDWQPLKNLITELDITDGLEGIFVDSYYATQRLLENLTVFKVPLFFLDDFQRLEYPKGVVFNPEISGDKDKYLKKTGRKVYAGVDYFPMRSPFWDMEPFPHIKRKGVAVTLGGSDDQRCLNLIITELGKLSNEPVTLVASDRDLLLPLPDNVTLLDTRQSADQMRNIISSARVIVCGGGGTLIEAARSGTPAVVIEMADNQRNNIKAWTTRGFARFAGHKSSPEVGITALRYIKELSDYNVWLRASRTGSSNADGQGARRIAGIILDETEGVAKSKLLKDNYTVGGLYLKNFLHCDHMELELLRNARNTPAVRAGSINQQLITLSRHQAFILSLDLSTTGGYWLVYSGAVPLGVVSLVELDWHRSQAVLGYYKLPDCLHKGVGKILVSAAKELTFNVLGLKTLLAECLRENIASAKSMEAAGMRNIGLEKRQINGLPSVILKYEANKDPDK